MTSNGSAPPRSRIGLIGAGNVGTALATRLVELGRTVSVANSRGPRTLHDFAHRTGARPVDLLDVGLNVDLLLLAVPLSSVPGLELVVRSMPEGAVVVDTGNYVPPRDGRIEAIENGLPETAWTAQQLGVPVVKAFNNIVAGSLAVDGRPVGSAARVALPICGDDAAARSAVMALAEEMGFTAYDAGPLASSWRQQPGQPAYCTNPTIAELPVLLRRADRQKGPSRRDQAMKVALKLPDTFPPDDLTRASRFSAGLDRTRPRTWLALVRIAAALARR